MQALVRPIDYEWFYVNGCQQATNTNRSQDDQATRFLVVNQF